MTDGGSQVELVTLAVFLCGGDLHAIDTEDIAVKANELAPGRFTWRKYPDQINLELVRTYLSAAKRRAGYLSGVGTVGWTLSPKGLAWAKSDGQMLLGQDKSRRREELKGGSIDEVRWRRERDRVLATEAWRQWNAGYQDISERNAEEVFRIDSYAIGRTRDMKIARLRNMFGDDPELGPFIANVAAIVERKE